MLLRGVTLVGVLGLASVVLVGCSGGDSTTSKPEPTLSSLWNAKFSSCGLNCHSPDASDGTENGPDLRSKDSFYTQLVGKNVNRDFPLWATVKSGNCNDIDFIAPGNPRGSTLVTSLVQSYSINQTTCTSSYNLHEVNRVTISNQDLIDALVTWINAGAPDN